MEYKTDDRAAYMHTAFVEFLSKDGADPKPGWAVTSEAELLVYYCPGLDVIYVWKFVELRKHLPRWLRCYPIRSAQNKGYKTWGVCVPLHEFEENAKVINISDYLGVFPGRREEQE